jgi:hypothetical protein
MSIKLMTKAWETSLRSGPKMVLLALCDNANDEGECYPGIPTIARKCSMSERAVQGHITDMETAGILQRNLRSGRSTLYRIFVAKFPTPAESAPLQGLHPTPADFAPPPPQPVHPTPAGSAPITITEPPIEPPVNPTPGKTAKKHHGTEDDHKAVRWMFDMVRKVNATAKEPNWDTWANDVRLMREIDGRTHVSICELFLWAMKDSFWCANVQSPSKLREKWDTLTVRSGRAASQASTPAAPHQVLATQQQSSTDAARALLFGSQSNDDGRTIDAAE